jgi:hypothetical protein
VNADANALFCSKVQVPMICKQSPVESHENMNCGAIVAVFMSCLSKESQWFDCLHIRSQGDGRRMLSVGFSERILHQQNLTFICQIQC